MARRFRAHRRIVFQDRWIFYGSFVRGIQVPDAAERFHHR